MTVAELIEKLQEYPQEANVICDRAYEDGYWMVEQVDFETFDQPYVYIGVNHQRWTQKITITHI